MWCCDADRAVSCYGPEGRYSLLACLICRFLNIFRAKCSLVQFTLQVRPGRARDGGFPCRPRVCVLESGSQASQPASGALPWEHTPPPGSACEASFQSPRCWGHKYRKWGQAVWSTLALVQTVRGGGPVSRSVPAFPPLWTEHDNSAYLSELLWG